MSRAIPLLAVLCTGIALGALIVAVIGSNRADPDVFEQVAPLDVAAAVPEIAQIRESRGSVLAGTALATKDDSAQFSSALADQAGTRVPQSEQEALIAGLQHLQSVYAERAQTDIDPGITGRPDKWRELADSAGLLLRELTEPPETAEHIRNPHNRR